MHPLRKFNKNACAAFTLAEVLIVLGIIGIIAELTIPDLYANFQAQVTVTRLKKSYSVLSQAYTMAVSENGSPDTWGLTTDGSGATVMLGKLKTYLKVTKDCGTGGNCFPDVDYKHFHVASLWGNGNTDSGIAKCDLADGTILAAIVSSSDCSTNFGNSSDLQSICGYYYVDINGFNGPNQVGKDFFLIYLTKNGLIPTGTSDETKYGFTNGCTDANASGWGCTAWTIYNGNTDYLTCPSSLSWTGNIKCP